MVLNHQQNAVAFCWLWVAKNVLRRISASYIFVCNCLSDCILPNIVLTLNWLALDLILSKCFCDSECLFIACFASVSESVALHAKHLNLVLSSSTFCNQSFHSGKSSVQVDLNCLLKIDCFLDPRLHSLFFSGVLFLSSSSSALWEWSISSSL